MRFVGYILRIVNLYPAIPARQRRIASAEKEISFGHADIGFMSDGTT